MIKNRGKISIGKNTIINTSFRSNPITHAFKSVLRCGPNSSILIGSNCKISNSIFISDIDSISIGNHVHIGAGSSFYTSDFHSLNFQDRIKFPENYSNVKHGDIVIHNYVFIGSHVTVLKNVKIGEGAIIGSNSLVTHNVPSYEIWAGIPARKIKNV
jgi:acetyltransferase-like isoleucine patch superfamily enzyme